MNSLTH